MAMRLAVDDLLDERRTRTHHKISTLGDSVEHLRLVERLGSLHERRATLASAGGDASMIKALIGMSRHSQNRQSAASNRLHLPTSHLATALSEAGSRFGSVESLNEAHMRRKTSMVVKNVANAVRLSGLSFYRWHDIQAGFLVPDARNLVDYSHPPANIAIEAMSAMEVPTWDAPRHYGRRHRPSCRHVRLSRSPSTRPSSSPRRSPCP